MMTLKNFSFLLLLSIVAMVGLTFVTGPAYMDFATPWQMLFQDPATPVMEGIIYLHHDIMFVLIIIGVSVFWVQARTMYLFEHSRNPNPSNLTHATLLEIVWTVTPAGILVLIAVPSLALLYSLEQVVDPAVTLKCIGHQWYWTYEYTDDLENPVTFDSYMVATDDLEPGQLRLLEVDNRVVLPTNTHIRLLMTGADVLHCWAVPSFGVKVDCVPGRLNQVSVFIKREGVYYGQCSELCGVNHGFMPIVVEAVKTPKYFEWLDAQA